MLLLQMASMPPFDAMMQASYKLNDPRLTVEALGMTFSNPIGLAAGFDKNACYLKPLSLLGFGFVEVGTITFFPQPGNPKPRIRRIPELQALWNRLGFNNNGAKIIFKRLQKKKLNIPIGINLGKSKSIPLEKAADDYLASFETLYLCGDYFVLNVSSPNTAGLRELQEKTKLSLLLSAIQEKNKTLSQHYQTNAKPLLLKISPDLDFERLDEILELALASNISGIIATNTTTSRTGISVDLPSEGGISGAPLKKRSTAMIRHIFKNVGRKICLIGVGGIFNALDAYEKIKAGASLVQIYTGLIYKGPGLVKEIKSGILECLKKEGANSIQEVIGKG